MIRFEDFVTQNKDELIISLAGRNKFLRMEWYKTLHSIIPVIDLIKERMKSYCKTARHIRSVERNGLDIYIRSRSQLINEVKFLGKIYRMLNKGLEDD